METHLADFIKDTPAGSEADSILRACVHCGFCNATCPTYQLLGDELDGPRGRIYQIKQVLEGTPATPTIQQHLDRCLTCRNCETTCPSGVQYGRLLDIGRAAVDQQVDRPGSARVARWGLRKLMITPGLFDKAIGLGRLVRPLLPRTLKSKILRKEVPPTRPRSCHKRKMILLEGCVQSTLKPTTNASAARILHQLGIDTISAPAERCCGAASFHLDAHEEALQLMRANIDAWWPYIDHGVEAIISAASGCGVLVKEYGYHLQDDAVYAEKARHVSALARDVVEVLESEALADLPSPGPVQRIAFHPPCTLQHGQKLAGRVEALLEARGFELLPVADSHLCCGSAGTYSILQKDLSTQLQSRKIAALEKNRPQVIATANIGCHLHLEAATEIPVVHWIELLDDPSIAL